MRRQSRSPRASAARVSGALRIAVALLVVLVPCVQGWESASDARAASEAGAGPIPRLRRGRRTDAPDWYKEDGFDDQLACEGTLWDAEQTPICFTHVSKAGGASFIEEGKKIFRLWFPQKGSGVERCGALDIAELSACCHALFLRSPRDHVFSLYRECVYDHWGRVVTNNTDFPRPQDDGGLLQSFEDWLDVFTAPPDPSAECGEYCRGFNCYAPQNYQSRSLTCSGHTGHFLASSDDATPNLNRVLSTMLRYNFVGVVDFFKESFCLFLSRIYDTSIPEGCWCGTQDDVEIAHKDHGAKPQGADMHSSGVDNMSEAVLAKIEDLTRVDSLLFVETLRRFFRDVKAFQARAKKTIMCKTMLDEVSEKLAYLGVDLTVLFDEA